MRDTMIETTGSLVAVLLATAAVRSVHSLTCYDCVSGVTTRTGKVPCDGSEQDWRTCSVEDGGSCLLLEQEDGTVRGCFASSLPSGCANITRSSQICYCDGDLCNVNRAATAEKSSTALQWLVPSSYRCRQPLCAAAAASLPDSKLVADLLDEFKLRPVTVQLHLNHCDPRSMMVTMILVLVLLFCVKFLLFVLQKLP